MGGECLSFPICLLFLFVLIWSRRLLISRAMCVVMNVTLHASCTSLQQCLEQLPAVFNVAGRGVSV